MATNTEVTSQVPAQEDTATLSRRQFLTRLSVGLGGLGAAIVGLPVIGFLLGPLFRRSPQAWRGVGAVDKFQIGQTVEVTFLDPSPLPWAGVAAGTAAWLRRDGQDQFRAFAVNCTHLGCPVRWLPDASLFMCPCHGGVFYHDGKVAAGPPPRPLSEYEVRVNNGQVEILTSPTPIG
ncbi:MAG: Rieske 2Fe-2S domain-containing protein [Herpetosiphonaceae bacterium]|nr:Rieske 2Fe-2S domain-containing protein [Herpetosiphonaceae bacterium]